MEERSLYEMVLGRLGEGAELPAPRPPRASASVVLWRRREGRLEVYWLRRARALAFMGGWYAFPGGGLLRRDGAVELAAPPRGLEGAPADAALPEAVTDGLELAPLLVPGLVSCALRELFEETGVLPGPGAATPDLLRTLAAARRGLLAGELDFPSLLRRQGLRLDASSLVYAGRWLTPPLGPLRYDNRFFLLEWPADLALQPTVLPGEAEVGEWVGPSEALERWRRGEVMTAPPILHILRVLGEEGPGSVGRLRYPQEANLGPFRRIEFRPGILLFPLATPTLPPASFTNAYLLGTEEAVLVDPGSPHEREIGWLRRALTAVEEKLGRRVTAIWLTHHHPDHVGGVESLRRSLGVPVLAHPLTAARLSGRGIRVDGELVDGQVVALGGDPTLRVRVLHTPGHARGHLCFLADPPGDLLAGDMVAGLGTIVIDPPEGDMNAYLESLARLREIAPRTLLPAHGPPLEGAAKLEEYLEHRLWRERRVAAAWREGRREPGSLVESVYADVPEMFRPLAERQVVAHLERLRVRGRLGE